MRRVLMFGLTLTTCLAAYTSSMAQEAKKGNYAYERLKGLEWMVGEWTAEGFHDESHIRIVATTKWLHDNEFLRSNWVFMDDGGVVHNREITWYWDPVQKVVRNQEFDSDGEWVRATVEVDDAVIRVRRDIVDVLKRISAVLQRGVCGLIGYIRSQAVRERKRNCRCHDRRGF